MALEVDLDASTNLLGVELEFRLGKLPCVRLEIGDVAKCPASWDVLLD